MVMIHWTVIIVQGTAKGKRNKVFLTFHLPVRYPLLLASKTTSRSDHGWRRKTSLWSDCCPLLLENADYFPCGFVSKRTASVPNRQDLRDTVFPSGLCPVPPRWGGCREIDLLILIMISVGEKKKSKMMELACGVLHIDQAAALCWVPFFFNG